MIDEAFAVALLCSQLRRLEVTQLSSDVKPTAFPALEGGALFLPRLAHLHTLSLSLSIGTDSLVRLLLSCPALEDVHLATFELSLTIFCALAHHSQLRRLALDSCRECLFNDSRVEPDLRAMVDAEDEDEPVPPFQQPPLSPPPPDEGGGQCTRNQRSLCTGARAPAARRALLRASRLRAHQPALRTRRSAPLRCLHSVKAAVGVAQCGSGHHGDRAGTATSAGAVGVGTGHVCNF